MKIYTESDGIRVKRSDNTDVIYYSFDEFEIHYNVIGPQTIQPWHHHEKIEETIFIVEGEMQAKWLDDQAKEHSQRVATGEIIRVENTEHTFFNSSNQKCVFIVFRFLPTGKSTIALIKNDKVINESRK